LGCEDRHYLGSDLKCYPCSSHCSICRSKRLCLKCDFGYDLEFLREKTSVICQEKKVRIFIFENTFFKFLKVT
jgi:hypothetical protein